MAKKQKEEEPTKQARVGVNSMKFLDSVSDEDLGNPSWIPPAIQGHINNYVRSSRKTLDQLMEAKEQYDKSSDEHVGVSKEIEHIAKTFINVKKEVDEYKGGIMKFKQDIGTMSKGTQDSTYFIGSSVFGNQFDELHIDKNGMFNFLSSPEEVGYDGEMGAARVNYRETGEWNMPVGGSLKLKDVPSVVKEPFGQKTLVFKLAEKTKMEKDSGKPFDDQWTYNNVLNNLTDAGPNATIGMAFTDLVGDGQTKSFAEMYEEGLKEEYYIHPDTGEELPEGLLWMKDPANADVVSKLLSKYVTNTMKDMHGSTVDGGGKPNQTLTSSELLAKYSKKPQNKQTSEELMKKYR
tara:strand:- start:8412 stop:9458 length:1047 start_codon:yes stop_codon:yes gene_type:complete